MKKPFIEEEAKRQSIELFPQSYENQLLYQQGFMAGTAFKMKKKEEADNRYKEEIDAVLLYFNVTCKTDFKLASKGNRTYISGRLRDGFTVDDLKLVINSKFKMWGSDVKMREYLRPTTLFGAMKFNGYLIQAKRELSSANPMVY